MTTKQQASDCKNNTNAIGDAANQTWAKRRHDKQPS
jgi:hypothetical protein